MGRGRAKAKQQKVARELKYNSHFTDLDALQRELSGPSQYPAEPRDVNGIDSNDDDIDDDIDSDDDSGEWVQAGR